VKFARALPAGSPFAPREFLANTDAPQLARDQLEMTQADADSLSSIR